jgi:hypothetical protein
LGYLDDLILVPLGITLALKMIPPEVMAEYRLRAQSATLRDKPKNWIVAGIILMIWSLLAAVSVRLLLHLLNQ